MSLHARFRPVLDHIDTHLDEDLSLERLSALAGYSRHHFHRQFVSLFGMGVYRYVQLCRLRRAGWQLAFRPGLAVIDIALGNAYQGAEGFSRAFRKRVGQSPSDFRRQPGWLRWSEVCAPLGGIRSSVMQDGQTDGHFDEVRRVDFPETRVALLSHRGDPRLLGESIRRFIEWRRLNHLPPRRSATFNLLYGDPDTVRPEDFRLDLCAAISAPVADNPYGVVESRIPAGPCAVLRHRGSEDGLAAAIRHLYTTWLPRSGAQPRDFPLFVQRLRFYPDVPEREAEVDIFLPLVG